MKPLKIVIGVTWFLQNVLIVLTNSTLVQQSVNDVLKFEKFMASVVSCDVEFEEPCSSGKIMFYIYKKKINTYNQKNKDLLNAIQSEKLLLKIEYSYDRIINIGVLDVVGITYNESKNESQNGVTALNAHLPLCFDKAKETKVIIHGFLGNVDSKDSAFIREVYRKETKFNLVVVDWGQLAKLPCYPTAVFSTWQAGKCTAVFLENFITDNNFTRVHAIGFSLGAHVAGFASNLLKQKLKKQLGRITGLDPALPFFASLDSAMKLDENDGDFVDLIHTNIGVFGKIEPTGHVDFYMNGGFYQPACQKAHNIPLCSHLMAIIYYAESVMSMSKGFWGLPCKSHFHYLIGLCFEFNSEDRVLMGDKCDHRSRGVYFVKTNNQPPFALG